MRGTLCSIPAVAAACLFVGLVLLAWYYWRWLCSLDNLIIIWDPAMGHKVQTLEGHTSFVKGVAWDPIGKYLASQSDDKTVKVRRACFWWM